MLALAPCCYGSDFVFIGSHRGVSAEQEEMQAAADFYGVTLRVVTAGSGADNLSIRTAVQRKETLGVAIDSDALSTVNEDALLRALNVRSGAPIPLLILGVRPDLSPALLKAWSGGEVTRCARVESSPDAQYVFGRVEGVTWQLADLHVPIPATNTSYFVLADKGRAQEIGSVRDGSKTFPVLTKSIIGHQIVFLGSATSEASDVASDQDVVRTFLRIAPAMMFVRYCAGERGWHSLHYYANFTIDDPWLREPYGYVDYKDLLGEMEKHNFHTTIAFIPWNYGRSQQEVVSLFKNHPDRFSIAVHGNNHNHKEFTDYQRKPLTLQVSDLKQALSRMERFHDLTGIPYDKVMIFPHSIAPEQTLGELKTYNYWATVNSSNVPQNATRRVGMAEILRPVTLSFEGFPSIGRYSPEMPEPYLAVNQFLGNSLFFYEHSDFFSKTIGAFDHVADEVNKREPATEWRSLGEIVKHLYVVKLRDDFDYDVLAFSNNISLENMAGKDSTFYVQKPEIGGQTIDSVTVDGMVSPYSLQEGQLRLVVAVPSGEVRHVAIQYANDLRLSSIDVSHDSAVGYLLRMGSDFRDIYLSKSGVGLAFIHFYNDHELQPSKVIGCLLLLLVAMSYTSYLLWVSVRKRSPSNHGRPHSVTN